MSNQQLVLIDSFKNKHSRLECVNKLLTVSNKKYRKDNFKMNLGTETLSKKLAEAIASNKELMVRNKALVLVLAATGLRVQEVLDLVPKDVDLVAGEITVLHGKGDKRRVVPILMRSAVDALERWMDVRKARKINGHHKLFCTLQGGSMKQQYVRQVLPRLAKRAGLEKRVHPHGMRHYFAATMVRRGLQPTFIQQLLGHKNLQTTTVYLQGLTNGEAVETARRVAMID